MDMDRHSLVTNDQRFPDNNNWDLNWIFQNHRTGFAYHNDNMSFFMSDLCRIKVPSNLI